MRTIFTAAAGLTVCLVAGCGSSSGGGASPADSGAADTTPSGEASIDAPGDVATETPSDGASKFPAFPDSRPQISKPADGKVIASPVFLGVYFGTDADQPTLDAMVSKFASSKYWSTLSEYGVGAATVSTSIAVTEAAPTAVTDNEIDTWLKGKLDGTHAEFGGVDATTLASKILVLFYPSTTTISAFGGKLCVGIGSYHAAATLASGAVAQYLVIPRCSGAPLAVSTSLTAMMVSAPTDPIGAVSGWRIWNDGQYARELDAPEVGTACQFLKPVTPPDLGFPITRIWSNAASVAFHDPCVPAPEGPYFTSVPVQKDDISFAAGSKIKGIKLAADGTADVEVHLSSDGPTTGPWTVKATSLSGPLTFTFDSSSGKNGDVLHLHIVNSGTAGSPFFLLSELGGRQTMELAIASPK